MTGELALVSDVDNKDSQPSEEKVAKNKKQAGKAAQNKSRSPSAKEKEKAKSPKGKKGSKTNKVEEAPQQGKKDDNLVFYSCRSKTPKMCTIHLPNHLNLNQYIYRTD
jgi:hypothetical protein